jgi:hypothetical protein
MLKRIEGAVLGEKIRVPHLSLYQQATNSKPLQRGQRVLPRAEVPPRQPWSPIFELR